MDRNGYAVVVVVAKRSVNGHVLSQNLLIHLLLKRSSAVTDRPTVDH